MSSKGVEKMFRQHSHQRSISILILCVALVVIWWLAVSIPVTGRVDRIPDGTISRWGTPRSVPIVTAVAPRKPEYGEIATRGAAFSAAATFLWLTYWSGPVQKSLRREAQATSRDENRLHGALTSEQRACSRESEPPTCKATPRNDKGE